MSFTKIRYISATYPRRSSDLCIHAITNVNDGNYACIFGVADVLGRKKEKKIKALIRGRFETLLKSRSNWNIDTLAEAVYEEILKINSDIRKVGVECKRERLYKDVRQSTFSNLFRMLTTKFTSGELIITECDNEVTIADNDITKEP
ncbi:MAG: hypothetical protein ACE5PV_07635, partial [Candidatus Poribacteria bacterium]